MGGGSREGYVGGNGGCRGEYGEGMVGGEGLWRRNGGCRWVCGVGTAGVDVGYGVDCWVCWVVAIELRLFKIGS